MAYDDVNEGWFEKETLHQGHSDMGLVKKALLEKYGMALGVEKTLTQRDMDTNITVQKQMPMEEEPEEDFPPEEGSNGLGEPDDPTGMKARIVQAIMEGISNQPDFAERVQGTQEALEGAKQAIESVDLENALDQLSRAQGIVSDDTAPEEPGMMTEPMPGMEGNEDGMNDAFPETPEPEMESQDIESEYPMEEDLDTVEDENEELKDDFKDDIPGEYLEGRTTEYATEDDGSNLREPGTYDGEDLGPPQQVVPEAEDGDSMKANLVSNWNEMSPQDQSQGIQRLAREERRSPEEMYEEIIQMVRGDEQATNEEEPTDVDPFSKALRPPTIAKVAGEATRSMIMQGLVAKYQGFEKQIPPRPGDNYGYPPSISGGSSSSSWDPAKHHGMTREQVQQMSQSKSITQQEHAQEHLSGKSHKHQLGPSSFTGRTAKEEVEDPNGWNAGRADEDRRIKEVAARMSAEAEKNRKNSKHNSSYKGIEAQMEQDICKEHGSECDGDHNPTVDKDFFESQIVKSDVPRMEGGMNRINRALIEKYGPKTKGKRIGKQGFNFTKQTSFGSDSSSWDPEKHHGMSREEVKANRAFHNTSKFTSRGGQAHKEEHGKQEALHEAHLNDPAGENLPSEPIHGPWGQGDSGHLGYNNDYSVMSREPYTKNEYNMYGETLIDDEEDEDINVNEDGYDDIVGRDFADEEGGWPEDDDDATGYGKSTPEPSRRRSGRSPFGPG